ncbi:unnamed protein product [Macrosiphum euphorbiae]|nr:unnamed protein product [Macrosiphum euphorbiae]
MDILKRCWTPPENYNFSEDAIAVGSKRKFNHSWLQAYAPWLAYSKILKGALCLYCEKSPRCFRFIYHQTFYTIQTIHAVANKSIFIMSVILIAKYSKLLEPVVNALQSKNLDLLKCSNFIKKIVVIVKDHREHADTEIQELLTAANIAAENIGAEINLPRIVKQQQHRSNPPALNSAEFWKRSLLIPYLDSLISSLERRFSDENIPAFSLLLLHPSNMLDMNTKEFKLKINDFANYYQIKDLESEAELWYNIWKEKKLAKSKLSDMEMSEVVEETDIFFPKIKQALHISLAQPCTTSTIERSFSTLRRVKTWLRSTMTENRLNGLCILSVHRKLLDEKKEEMQQKILSRFCEDSRRLSLL